MDDYRKRALSRVTNYSQRAVLSSTVENVECNTLVLAWAAHMGCEESHPYPLHTHIHFRIVIRSAIIALSVTCFPVQGIRNPIVDVSREETARILRKARRQKRKYCNPIIIN